jgi:hypothetical protein
MLKYRLYCLLLFIVCAFGAFAQKKKAKKEKRHYPMTFLNVEYAYQQSQLFINKNYLLYGIWDENIGYTGQMAWNARVQYGYAFHRNYDLAVGLAYERHQITQTKGFDYIPCEPERFGATKIVDAHRVVRARRLEIPVDFRYKWYHKNFAFAPSLGLGFAFYNTRNQEVNMFLDNGRIGENIANDTYMQQSRGVNMNTLLKLGFIYELDTKLALKIEPFYKHYWIKEPFLDNYKNVNAFNMGIMIGFEHTLGMAAKVEKHKSQPKKKK